MKKKQQPLPEPEPQQRVETYALSSGIVTILPNESRAGLVKIETDLNNEFKPNTPHERFLVDRAISARWKVLRFRRLEAKLAEEYAESDAADDSSVLDTLEQSGNLYEKLDRMIASVERTGAAAIRELTQYRASALKVEKQSQIAESETAQRPDPGAQRIDRESRSGAHRSREDRIGHMAS